MRRRSCPWPSGVALSALACVFAAPWLVSPSRAQGNPPASPPALASSAEPAPEAVVARLAAQPMDCAGAASAVSAATAGGDTARGLGLNEVLRAVVCRHVGVRQGEGLLAQAQAAVLRARGQSQPALGLSLGVDGESGSRPTRLATLRLDWVLFDFGARDAALLQAREAVQAVLSEQQGEALAAVAQAALDYSAAQSAQARREATMENLRIAELNARIAQVRQGSGVATLTERLQAQRAQAQARLNQARANTAWAAAAGTLQLAVGLPPTLQLRLAADPSAELPAQPGPALAEADLPALIAEAERQHPRVLAAQRRLNEAEQRIQAAQAERWGSVRLNARAGRAGGDNSDTSSRSAGLEWSVPLFDRDVQRSRMGDARGQALRRQALSDEAQRQVAQQVWQEGQALIGEREALRATRELLDAADQALRVAGERFRLGASSFTELLLAQEAAASARLQAAEAQARLLQARWRLAAALGRLGPLAGLSFQ